MTQSDNTVREQQTLVSLWQFLDLSGCKKVTVKNRATEKAQAGSLNLPF